MYIHTSEFVSFKCIQYSTWCQNRGCICISSTRRTYRLNPAVSCIQSVIQARNIILQTELFLQEEGKREIPIHLLNLQLQSILHINIRTRTQFYSVSTCNPVIPSKEIILHIELILLPQEISKKYYNYKAHPMQADTRHPPATVPHAPKHSTWQKPSWTPYKDSQASSNSTRRNSILSSRQHPHTPYKIPQAHFYRILQGEIGFSSKGLSIALSCSTKVSNFKKNHCLTVSCA